MRVKTIVFITLAFISCDSKENKYKAFEQVREAKKQGKDIYVYNEDSTITTDIKKNLNEWEQYKIETLHKINATAARIKELRKRKVDAGYQDKFNKQIDKLEKKNNDLKNKIDAYYKEREARWNEFQLDIEHQSDEIKTEIKFLKQSKGNQENYLKKLFK